MKYIITYRSFDKKYGYNKTMGGDGGDTFSYKPKHKQTQTKLLLKTYMIQNPQGISKESIKGKHITESCPEIKKKWDKNFKSSMKKLSERRKSGKLTSAEKNFIIP